MACILPAAYTRNIPRGTKFSHVHSRRHPWHRWRRWRWHLRQSTILI